MDVQASLQDNDVILRVTDTHEIQDIIVRLSQAGVEVKDMYIKRDSLEDVFLNLIGAQEREVVAQ